MKKPIKEIYIYVAPDPETGEEGILALRINGSDPYPMFEVDRARVKDMKKLMDEADDKLIRSAKLIRLSNREDIPDPKPVRRKK